MNPNFLPIVLFGGTFDPVHNGHVAMAEAAAATFSPQKLIVLPAGNPYQRGRLPFSSSHDRIAMLSAAFGLVTTKVVIDKRELHRTGPTYTVDTLQELRQELGESASLIWLIGADAFSRLDTWHHWQNLFDLTHFAVVMRPGEPSIQSAAGPVLAVEIQQRHTTTAELHGQPAGRIVTLGITPPEVSSTLIRARCQNGESIRGLVPDAVCDYIGHHKLYLNRN